MTSPKEQAMKGLTFKEIIYFYEVLKQSKQNSTTQEIYNSLIRTENETLWFTEKDLKAQAEQIFKEMGDISMKSPRIVEKGYLRLRKKYLKEE